MKGKVRSLKSTFFLKIHQLLSVAGICFILFPFSIGGCLWRTSQGITEKSQTELSRLHPEWWKYPPPSTTRYFFGVGSSLESRKKAVQDARDNIIRSLYIFVSAERYWREESSESDTAKNFTVDMIEYRVERYRSFLPPTEEQAHYFDENKNQHYALVSLKKVYIKRQGVRDQEIVRAKYKSATRLWSLGNKIRSIEEYINALSYAKLLLEGTRFNSMKLTKNGELVVASHAIETDLKSRLGEIRLSKQRGDNQKGYLDDSLKNPLVVKASVENQPIKGIPIFFGYTTGHGKLGNGNISAEKVHTETDINGNAMVSVIKIKSISQKNEILAKIDFSPFFNVLADKEKHNLIRQIAKGFEGQEVLFWYQSSFFQPKGQDPLTILLDGKSIDPIFANRSKVTLSMETNQNQGTLHIFHLNDSGEIRFMNCVDINKSQVPGTLVIQHNTYGSTMNIYNNKLIKEAQSPELEAIIVIGANKRSLFEKNHPVSVKQIITNFNANSPDSWSVGQLGYQVH